MAVPFSIYLLRRSQSGAAASTIIMERAETPEMAAVVCRHVVLPRTVLGAMNRVMCGPVCMSVVQKKNHECHSAHIQHTLGRFPAKASSRSKISLLPRKSAT